LLRSLIKLCESESDVSRRRDVRHPADRLDAVSMAVLVDEPPHDLERRSRSAWGKKVRAQGRIALALRGWIPICFRTDLFR
jgi:hypothetical protein